MATYRILYWQEVPSQIRAEDETGEVNLPLPQKFMVRIDALAAARGLEESDDYLAQWRWSDDAEREGSAQAVADAIARELEAQADW
jgi:Virulence factor